MVFEQEYYEVFASKLGLSNGSKERPIIDEFLSLLEVNSLDFTNSFRNFINLQDAGFEEWRKKWRKFVKDENDALRISAKYNPYLIPRNHQIQMIIDAAQNEDFLPFERMLEAIQNPLDENKDFADLTKPPKPEEVIANTFCGT